MAHLILFSTYPFAHLLKPESLQGECQRNAAAAHNQEVSVPFQYAGWWLRWCCAWDLQASSFSKNPAPWTSRAMDGVMQPCVDMLARSVQQSRHPFYAIQHHQALIMYTVYIWIARLGRGHLWRGWSLVMPTCDGDGHLWRVWLRVTGTVQMTVPVTYIMSPSQVTVPVTYIIVTEGTLSACNAECPLSACKTEGTLSAWF